jgi:hypothetical protein
MKRTISIERLYTIADYQNIKFTSTLSDIPEEIMQDEDAVGLLYYSQGLECDMAYKRYMQLRDRITREKVTDVLEFLEEERTKTNTQLIKNNQQEN